MKRVVALALAVAACSAGRGSPLPADRPALLDDFDNPSAWSAHPSDGVSLRVSSDAGFRGQAMRLDFDFHGRGGYAVARRKFNFAVPANYEFSFRVRGDAPPNTLEFKLIDPSGDNVWWANMPAFEFPRDWAEVVRKKRHITFAWGPKGGGDLSRVAAIEIAITAGSGGRGTVWIDELQLRPREPDRPYALTPRVAASAEVPAFAAALALDGDTATAWRAVAPATPPPPAPAATPAAPDAAPALVIDFLRGREFGGLVLDWEPGRAATSYTIDFSPDGRAWTRRFAVASGNGGRDYLYLPESDTRFLRLAVASAESDTIGLREVAVQPLAWSASKNDFFAAIAADAVPGSYPKYLGGVQSYWTVVGVDGDSEEALVNEEGMIEAGKGRFSVEPFIRVDGRLVTWSDVRASQALAHRYLPMPSVTWDAGDFSLTVGPAIPAGMRDSSAVYARYTITNRRAGRRRFTLYLALRPFQVNPSWQFLSSPGGVATTRDVAFDGRVVRVNGAEAVVPFSPPAAFGAAAFDEGNIVDFLRAGRLPAAREVRDPFGHASAALAFEVDADSGRAASVTVAIPLHPAALSMVARDRDGGPAAYERRSAGAVRGWREAVEGVVIELPSSAQRVTDAIRANLAYVLVNRDGAGIQPGSRSYERSWIRDGALTSTALLRLGRADVVREFIEWFASFQYPSGKVPCCVDRRGAAPVPENDSHGQLIYLVAEYWRHTRDTALVQRVWPNVERAVAYMDSLRRSRMTPEFASGEKRVFYGLLPASISHEGYSAKPMHSYWDDFFALRGFKDAAELAHALGRPEAYRYMAVRDEFRTHVYESIRLAMTRHGIDFIPGAAELGDFDATSTTVAVEPGGEAGRLPAPALHRTFERYWEEFVARREGAKSWDAYTPYELRTMGTMVRFGRRDRAHAALEWFLGHQRPAPWLHWAEVVHRDPAAPRFIGDMPHTWVGSDYIRSVLDMLAFERESDSTLVVGAGVPDSWVSERPGVTVRRLSTHYGPLSFTMRRENGGVRISMQAGLRLPPGGVVVVSPFAAPPRERLVNGIPSSGPTTSSVTVRSLPAEVVFRR